MAYFTGTRDFGRLRRDMEAMQAAVRESPADAWVLFDLRARNGVTAAMTGLGELSRRYFVVIPGEGEPVAITHGIEQGPWDEWPWQKKVYVGWQELAGTLKNVLATYATVAMETSENSAVPIVDLVPAGVVDLVRGAGPKVISSGDLVTRFYSFWSPAQLQSHRTAAAALAQVANATFTRLARAVEAGEQVNEDTARLWVLEDLAAHGVGVGADAICATGQNAANPHYSPVNGGAVFRRGHVVLLDLWAKQAEDMVYADQTWMGFLGPAVPDRAAKIFAVIRDAREAAVEFLHRAWQEGRVLEGREVDDVARNVVNTAGYGAFFIHRTGHSIDTATHGMGPNIDNLETRETRKLVPGVGFSIEPGIYIPGEIGMRTEINVYIGDDGPEVTTPSPQREISPLLPR